jgi:hypothetical protein
MFQSKNLKERNLEDIGIGERIITDESWRVVDCTVLSDSRWDPVADFCGHSNEFW